MSGTKQNFRAQIQTWSLLKLLVKNLWIHELLNGHEHNIYGSYHIFIHIKWSKRTRNEPKYALTLIKSRSEYKQKERMTVNSKDEEQLLNL